MLQETPRGSSTDAAGAEAQLAVSGTRDDPLAGDVVCVTRQPHDVLDPLDRKRARHHGGAHGITLGLVQGVDHRGALGRADRDPRLFAAGALWPSATVRAPRAPPARPAARSCPSRAPENGRPSRSPRGLRETHRLLRRPRTRVRAGGRPGLSSGPAPQDRACASTSRCRAARAAGSRTGRVRPCRPRRSRNDGRAHPACRVPNDSRSRREAKMSA